MVTHDGLHLVVSYSQRLLKVYDLFMQSIDNFVNIFHVIVDSFMDFSKFSVKPIYLLYSAGHIITQG